MYNIVITIIAVALLIECIFLKFSLKAVCKFCEDKFRKPTEKEIAEYSKKVIGGVFRNNST